MNNIQSAGIIKDLCKTKGYAVSKVLLECNIRKSLIYDMEKRDLTPSVEVFEKIADKLSASIDYLVGRTDVVEINNTSSELYQSDTTIITKKTPTYAIKAEDRELLNKINTIPSLKREVILNTIETEYEQAVEAINTEVKKQA